MWSIQMGVESAADHAAGPGPNVIARPFGHPNDEAMPKMTSPQTVFAGFLAKQVEPRPAWLSAPAVQDICSVSECISKAPEDRLLAWKHNEYGFYDSLDDARSVITGEEARLDMFAYEILLLRGLEGRVDPVALVPAAGSVPVDFEFLGYDIVTRSEGAPVECSPLSCNRVAEQVPTNLHCLVASEAEALDALLMICAPGFGAEPGPYYLVKVFRQPRPSLQAG